jgi:hypothetical protein
VNEKNGRQNDHNPKEEINPHEAFEHHQAPLMNLSGISLTIHSI